MQTAIILQNRCQLSWFLNFFSFDSTIITNSIAIRKRRLYLCVVCFSSGHFLIFFDSFLCRANFKNQNLLVIDIGIKIKQLRNVWKCWTEIEPLVEKSMERKMDGFDVGHLRERSKPFWHFLYKSFFEQFTLF